MNKSKDYDFVVIIYCLLLIVIMIIAWNVENEKKVLKVRKKRVYTKLTENNTWQLCGYFPTKTELR